MAMSSIFTQKFVNFSAWIHYIILARSKLSNKYHVWLERMMLNAKLAVLDTGSDAKSSEDARAREDLSSGPACCFPSCWYAFFATTSKPKPVGDGDGKKKAWQRHKIMAFV
jgi:hypothetical protein